jgi:hypothetical protein
MKCRSAQPLPIRLLITAGLTLATGTLAAPAQEPAPYTLHAYANLVQVPALVLDMDRKPLPPVKREQFSISLDSGPLFHPTQMRMEGDDPITLAVLLDVSGDHDDILKSFLKTFPTLAPQFLHPHDHVSIYALGCAFVRSINDIPADPDTLKAGLDVAVSAPALHDPQQHGACANVLPLWDAVRQVTTSLGNLPGRRVLLIVSNGKDGKSVSSFNATGTDAISNSVTIFGMRDWIVSLHAKEIAAQRLNAMRPPAGVQLNGVSKDEDLFELLCGSDGGFVLNISPHDVLKSLQTFVTMLRSRYILEYPRPDAGVPGLHTIAITVPGNRGHVWAPGVSYPSADPSVLTDPTTIHSTASPAEFGTRRPLSPNQ